MPSIQKFAIYIAAGVAAVWILNRFTDGGASNFGKPKTQSK